MISFDTKYLLQNMKLITNNIYFLKLILEDSSNQAINPHSPKAQIIKLFNEIIKFNNVLYTSINYINMATYSEVILFVSCYPWLIYIYIYIF